MTATLPTTTLKILQQQNVTVVNAGIENGYNEVNVQIPAEYKYVFPQQIMLGQENVATYVPEINLRSNSI